MVRNVLRNKYVQGNMLYYSFGLFIDRIIQKCKMQVVNEALI